MEGGDAVFRITWIDWVIVIGYFVGALGIGYSFRARASESLKSFWLAGGKLGVALATATMMATWFGIDVTIGFAENGFRMGLAAGLFWIVPYYLVRVPLVLWVPIARTVMPEGVDTIAGYMEYLYGKRGVAGKLNSLLAALLTAFRSGHAMHSFGMGLLLSHIMHLDPVLTTFVVALVVAVYTAWGGLFADAVTDFAQFVIMMLGMGVVVPVALRGAGGWAGIADAVVRSVGPKFLHWSGGQSASYLLMWVLIALSMYVDPSFYQRFQAPKTTRLATLSLLACFPMWIIYAICAVLVGIIGRAMYPDLPAYQAVLNVYLGHLPPILMGLWLAGFFAAGMSSQDSFLLIFGTTLAKDVYQKFINPRASTETLLKIAKWAVLIWGPVAGVIYASGFKAVIDVWAFLASFYGAALLVPIAVGMIWTRRKSALGGLFSLVGGIGTYVIWNALRQPWGVPSLLASWIVSFALFLIGNQVGQAHGAPWRDASGDRDDNNEQAA